MASDKLAPQFTYGTTITALDFLWHASPLNWDPREGTYHDYSSKLSIKGLPEVLQYSKAFACEVINADCLILYATTGFLLSWKTPIFCGFVMVLGDVDAGKGI
jgi:hypothetical protein